MLSKAVFLKCRRQINQRLKLTGGRRLRTGDYNQKEEYAINEIIRQK